MSTEAYISGSRRLSSKHQTSSVTSPSSLVTVKQYGGLLEAGGDVVTKTLSKQITLQQLYENIAVLAIVSGMILFVVLGFMILRGWDRRDHNVMIYVKNNKRYFEANERKDYKFHALLKEMDLDDVQFAEEPLGMVYNDAEGNANHVMPQPPGQPVLAFGAQNNQIEQSHQIVMINVRE